MNVYQYIILYNILFMVRRLVFYIMFLFTCLWQSSVYASNSYYEINIQEEIGSTSWLHLKNGMDEAHKQNVKAIILHLNTYGGLVVYADSMRTRILNSRIPVYVFIDNNAASAGALVSIACDSIYMRKGANIGAATVVDESGEKMPDKYQSYMRSTIRSTAEAQGKKTVVENGDTVEKWRRDPRIAEAMVDEHVVVPGIVDSAHILTFTATEAVANGYCEGVYESVDEIIQSSLKDSSYNIITYQPSFYDSIMGWLMNPILHGILIMIILGGIYFEMQTPGIGFPLAASVLAAILYFAPLYIDGLSQIWEALVFVLGIILILVEIFVIPGFGVTGVLGIIFVTAGLILSLVNNDWFDFDRVPTSQLGIAALTVFLSLVFSIGLIAFISIKIGTKGMFKSFALDATQEVDKGFVGVESTLKDYVGKTGVAMTDLRPSGKVQLEGDVFDAVAESGYIESGTNIRVTNSSSAQLYVKKA